MVIYLGLIIHIIVRRKSSAFFILITLGLQQIVNEVILKKSLAEHRPVGACSSSYGLPSGHSSFAATWITWLTLEWILLHGKVPFKTSKFYAVLTSLSIFLAPLIPISRYYLNYHSIKQICYGLLVGFVSATIHFCIVMAIVYKSHHNFENSMMTKFLKKLKFIDDYVSYEASSQENIANQEDLEDQIKIKIEQKLIVPLREEIHRFIWRYRSEVSQEKSSDTSIPIPVSPQ